MHLARVRTPTPVTLDNQTTWVNSGIMGREQGQYRRFSVTFTAPGTYDYICIVHGTMMSGKVRVVRGRTPVPSASKDKAVALHQIARLMAKVPAVLRAAHRAEVPASMKPDGTWTHTVLLGYSKGQIDLMRFFPGTVGVRPGDSVQWIMTANNDAPHTVTFLNGGAEPSLVVPVPQQSGPPVLYLNPDVLGASHPAPTLLRTGYYNSGLLQPIPGTTYTLTVGDVSPGPLRYVCQLHDTSGMIGTLTVRRQ